MKGTALAVESVVRLSSIIKALSFISSNLLSVRLFYISKVKEREKDMLLNYIFEQNNRLILPTRRGTLEVSLHRKLADSQ